MLLTILLFLASAAAIYIACEFFVNGIEWVGRRYGISETATGTVLAAFGTALPESAVTFVAVVFGTQPAQKDIGVGAALGGPLVLATISYAVVGLVLMSSRRRLGRVSRRLQTDQKRLSRDQAWFLMIFAVKVALGLVAFAWKPWTGVLFLAAYALYVWKEMGHEDLNEDMLEPLKFRPGDPNPGAGWALLQSLVALAVIGVASHVFVHQLEHLGAAFHIAPHVISLLLSPVATELPETMNAVIWVRQGKERLALANISGAMMIQATVPSALGIFFTPWLFDHLLLAAGVVTMVAVAILCALFRMGIMSGRMLAPIGLVYGMFLAAVSLTHAL